VLPPPVRCLAARCLARWERFADLAPVDVVQLVAAVHAKPGRLARPLLRLGGRTLLHGDYWPGNIGQPVDGRQIVFDWQRAAIGPAILDLQHFCLTVSMVLQPPLPVEDLVALYRQEMAWRVAPAWDEEHFALLWDHALLWHFLSFWLRRMATFTPETYALYAAGFERVWLEPAIAAMGRLGVHLLA